MKEINISIIIPVYNVEKYLQRMIDSILIQTYKNYEIILVDDGSTDNSGIICDKYKQNNNNIIVIHKQNEGAHIARNIGINLSQGKYLCFFDADDYIEQNKLLDMYDLIESNKLDLLISGFYIETYVAYNKYITYNYIPIDDRIYHGEYEFRMNAYKYFNNNMLYSPWNKIYKKDYIINNNLQFPITYRDDFPFIVSIIKNIKNIGFTKKQYYHFYRERLDSETSKFYKNLYEKRQEEHQMMLDLYNFWELENDYNSKEMISRRYVDRLFECIVNNENIKSNYNNLIKNNNVKLYLDNIYFADSIKYAKPNSIYLKIIYYFMKHKNIIILRYIAKLVNYIKIKNNKIFSNLKIYR